MVKRNPYIGIDKSTRGGITIKTVRLRSYPGDSSVQIQAIDERGRKSILFNIWPTTVRGIRWWRNDRYPSMYRTITEAKNDALSRFLAERRR